MRTELNGLRNLHSHHTANPSISNRKSIRHGIRTKTNQNMEILSKDRFARFHESSFAATCVCYLNRQHLSFDFVGKSYFTFYQRNPCKSCRNRRSTTNLCALEILYGMRLLGKLINLIFKVTYGAGAFSTNFQLCVNTNVKRHHLEPFFRDLYRQRNLGNRSSSRITPYSADRQDSLVRIAHRRLWEAFRSGAASPSDVDENGWTLIHVG